MLPLTRFLALPSSRLLAAARTVALAVALAAPIAGALGVTPVAHAQMSRNAPSPVSATDFGRMLADCGLPDTTRDVALPLHEAYFARFREFESREVDPALDRTAGGDFALSNTIDGAKEARDTRRRLFQRAAQMDAQLVDELVGMLTAEDAVRAEGLRDALTRRRATIMLGSSGFNGRPESFDLRATEALRTLDATARAAVQPTFDAYGVELTRAVERAADARLEIPVKAAELRAERGIPETPVIDSGNDGGIDGGQTETTGEPGADGAGADESGSVGGVARPARAIDESWFRRNAEIQREASDEFVQARSRVRRIHRDTLANIEPLVPASVARAMRADLVRAIYPRLASKNAFDAALAEAEGLRAKGKIDDAQWSAAEAIIDGHDMAARGVLGELMDLADKRAGTGELDLFAFGAAENGASEEAARSERLTKELNDLAARDADALRATLGLEAVAPQIAGNGRTIEMNGVDISAVVGEAIGGALGGAIGDEGTVQVQAIMVGGDGEMISLTSDDMDDSGMMFVGGFAGGGGLRVPKPMTREELDAVAACSGLDGALRPTFDEIAARCVEARSAATEAHGAPGAGAFANLDGGVSLSFTIGSDAAVAAGNGNGDGDTKALVAAIATAEETMFDEIRASAATDRGDAVEAARRARARVRLLTGEVGAHAVDIVRVADAAAIAPTTRTSIDAALRTWDESSVGVLETMRRELTEVSERRQEIFEKSMEETTTTDDDGGANMARTMALDGDGAKELARLDERAGDAVKRVSDANERTRLEVDAMLAGDADAQKAFRRAYLRAANPTVYRGERDLAPYFEKAAAIAGVGEQARADIARLRGDLIEEREARFESFIRARDEAERAAKARTVDAGDPGAIEANAREGMRQMQESMRERKRLRDDLEQIEATVFRRLQDLLVIEVGADKAKELGELPAKKKPRAPMIRFGG